MPDWMIPVACWFAAGVPGAAFVYWLERGSEYRGRRAAMCGFSMLIGPVGTIAAASAILCSLVIEVWLLVSSRGSRDDA